MKKINLKIKGVDLNLYDLARLSVLSMFTLLTFNVLGKQFPNQVHEISKSTKNEEEMDIIKIDLNKLSRSNWTAQERKNAEVVVDFVQHLMNNHDFDYVKEKFGKNP
ncbi:MAG: hypothetical protein MRY83_01520, partial [Flavobacteriales bacterium]|nr:hypothetical protein [Flavobacteriales bacterium]